MKLNELSKNIALLVFSVIISFIMAELLLAAFDISVLKQDSDYRTSDDVFHHSFVPNSSAEFKSSEWDVKYNINSFGFRDREFSIKKPDNVFRVLMLGDSFTEGYGMEVENSFPKQFESILNQRSDKKYEVINTGVGSYSPIIEYLILKQKGILLQPDMVILNYDWSDALDDYKYSKLAVWDGEELIAVKPELQEPESFFAGFRDFLSRRSHIYQFFAKRFAPVTSKIIPYDMESDRLIFLRDNLSDEDYLELFNNSAPFLLKIKELLEQQSILFVIHIYPYGLQLSTEAWSQGRSTFFFSKEKTYPLKPFEIVESFADEHTIPVVNSYSYFKKEDDYKSLYFDYDGHFTEPGHKIVANALYDYFENSNLT